MFAIHPAALPVELVRKCAVRHPPDTLDVTLVMLALLVGPARLNKGMPLVSAVNVEEGVPEKSLRRSPASLSASDVKEMVTYCPATAGQNFTMPLTLFE